MSSQNHGLRDSDREIARLREQVRRLEDELAQKKHPAVPDFPSLQFGQSYSREQVSAILESMPSAVVIIAADSGRFIYINRRAHELYGADYRGVALTDHVLQVKVLRPDGTPFPAEDLPASRSMRNGEVVQSDEMIIQRPGGEQLTVLVSSSPLFDTQGMIVAAVVSFRDITGRKQAENTLKVARDIAEERTRELEAVVESVPDGLAVFGRYRQLIFVNETGRQRTSLFMMPPDPDTGNVELVAYDEDGRRILQEEEAVNQIFTHGETIREKIYSTAPDREPVIWIALSGAPIRDESGRIIGAVVLSRDITDRRKVERTVAFQAHLLNSVQDAIIATDGAFHITYWNHASETLLGWTAAEALSQSSLTLLNPIVAAEPTLDEAIDRLWATDTYIGEVVYHHKDGTAIAVDNNAHLIRDGQGNVRETITTMRDIRQRKGTDQALRESERKYRELVRHAPTAIYEIDIPSRHFLTVNDCMSEMTGYTREELLAMDAMTLMDEPSYQVYLSRMRQWERGQIPDPRIDYTWTVKGGKRVHVALNTTFVLDERGQPKVMTVIAHDITERKKLELALLRQAQELLAADRNKNQFLNMLSHELRNHLAAIIASLDLLTHFKPDEERTHRAVRVLRRQAGHLAHLVDDLLDVTRITTGKLHLQKGLVDIVGLVQRSAADLQKQYEDKGVDLTVELPRKPMIIEADSVRLTQATSNLLHNALKFTPAGGNVTVSVTQRQQPAESSSKAEHCSPRQEIQISFVDNGAGIDPELLPHIFEPFSQAEQPLARTQGGLGLGLAIVKGMVELHGGRVDVQSDGVGRGARFIIHLPMSEPTD